MLSSISRMEKKLLVAAIALGIVIAYFDSRPSWDDTGVTAVGLFALASLFGFLGLTRPWIWGLALGVWIPLVEVAQSQSFASVVALAVALLGAYAGAAVRVVVSPACQGSSRSRR